MPFLLMLSVFTFVCGLFFPPLLLVALVLGWIVTRTVRRNYRGIRDAEQARARAAYDRDRDQAMRYFA